MKYYNKYFIRLILSKKSEKDKMKEKKKVNRNLSILICTNVDKYKIYKTKKKNLQKICTRVELFIENIKN